MSQRPPILKPNESYTFRSYFLMKFAPGDILRELGASLTKGTINLPIAQGYFILKICLSVSKPKEHNR
jgi:hypothetical protein